MAVLSCPPNLSGGGPVSLHIHGEESFHVICGYLRLPLASVVNQGEGLYIP